MKLSPMVKRFLLYFISVSALLGFVFWLFYQSDIKFHEHLFESQETAHVNLQSKTIAFHFQNIESDLAILSELHQLRKFVESHEDYSSKGLENDFLSISLRKGIYDQIRFINKTGQEMLRVNYNNGKPLLVPEDRLQNKAGRYYFKKTMNLNKEKVYVSPIDLNIEGGEVEKPFKPMIRFGTPIFNMQDEKQGILILNFMAQFMIDSFENSRRDSLGQNHLLNSDGYWLSSPNPGDEWGFMLEERKNKAFSNRFPDEWTTILEEETGQFTTHKGLFTFTTFYPDMETQKLKSVLDKSQRVSIPGARANFWKIVSFVPHETLYQALREESKYIKNNLLVLYASLVLLTGAGVFLFVKADEEKRKAELLVHEKTKFIQLSQEITITANEAATVEKAMQICIDKICSFTKWPIGHGYITDSMGTLIPSKIWHIENEERFKVFRKITEDTSFDKGVGLPGRVLASGKPSWITDVTKEPWFLRAKFVKAIGVKSGFAFPVLEGKKVVAVLEFFSEKTSEPDKSLLEALSNLAVQVGRVTERKRAEESLKNSLKQLEEFAFIVSHDLKAPLRAISSLAGWIAEDYKEALDDKGREWLKRLLGKTEHMNNLISGILAYSRIDKNESEKVTLDSCQIVSKVIKSLGHPENLEIQKEGGFPDIYYNETQLEQVFQNLIENAIKHIGKPKGKVVISYRSIGKFHEFCVKDNGVGIEEEHFERIFKMFQYLNQDKGSGSTGIGLALVKKIIDNNNGTVWVESKKGEGSAFYFTIPK